MREQQFNLPREFSAIFYFFPGCLDVMQHRSTKILSPRYSWRGDLSASLKKYLPYLYLKNQLI